MSDEKLLLSIAGLTLLAVSPIFVYLLRAINREGVKLEAGISALANFLLIFSGLPPTRHEQER